MSSDSSINPAAFFELYRISQYVHQFQLTPFRLFDFMDS